MLTHTHTRTHTHTHTHTGCDLGAQAVELAMERHRLVMDALNGFSNAPEEGVLRRFPCVMPVFTCVTPVLPCAPLCHACVMPVFACVPLRSLVFPCVPLRHACLKRWPSVKCKVCAALLLLVHLVVPHEQFVHKTSRLVQCKNVWAF